MPLNARATWVLLKETGAEWTNDNAPRLGAALAYYTVFAIPPLFVIVLSIASLVFDPESVRSQLFQQVGGLVGETGAGALQSTLAAPDSASKGIIASILAGLVLLVTATGLFIELQSALNTIWGVEAKPGNGVRDFIRHRLLSFAMVVGVGFLLLVSLIVSAALAALSSFVSALVPGLDVLWMVANAIIAFAVVTVLFAMVFKVLPDVKIAWRDVWIGAALTALLFTAGKFLMGMFLGKTAAVSAYGAAGSLVLILLWVYYSSQILFLGAEFTQVYANRYGARLEPKPNAQWVATPAAQPAAKAAKTKPLRRKQLLAELKDEVENLRELVHH
jgi:membrane protein